MDTQPLFETITATDAGGAQPSQPNPGGSTGQNPLGSLLSIQTVDDTHTVLIGYRDATLMGIGGNGAVQGQEVQIALGADTPRIIRIVGERLYLQPGATYAFPGKDVTIVARWLGMASAADEPCTISVSGAQGADATPPTPPKRGKVAQAAKGRNSGSHSPTDGHDGNAGANGSAGASGNAGNHAGKITVYVHQVDPGFKLRLIARGGDGSDGLDGQDGQDGQDGGIGGNGEAASGSGNFFFPGVTAGDGGDGGGGGNGGDGGAAGDGGNGGSITFVSISACPPGAVSIDVSAGAAGAHGKSGRPGTGGKGGAHGKPSGGNSRARDGHDGKDGRGGTSAPETHRTALAGLSVVRASVQLASYTPALSVEQLAAVVHRLRFEYLTRLTFPTLSDLSTTEVQPADATLDSLEWLNQVVPSAAAVATSKAPDPRWQTVQTLLADLSLKVSTRLDFYGNRFDLVPQLNVDVSLLAQRIADLSETEQFYQSMLEALSEYETNKQEVQSTFSRIATRLSDDLAEITRQTVALRGPLADAIAAAHEAVLAAQRTLTDRFEAELASIAGKVSWSVPGLLGSLSTVLMFAGPEFSLATAAGKAFAAGGVMSAASAFDPSRIDAGGGTVDKSYLLARIRNIEATLDALHTAWGDDRSGFLTPTSTNEMLAIQRDQLIGLLDEYFPSATRLRAAIDDYLDDVQVQNNAVLDYNTAVAALLTAEADMLAAQDAADLLAGSLEELDSSGLQQLYGLASHAYATQLLEILRTLYAAGRAYACLALSPSSSLNQLAAIDGLGEVTSAAIKAALVTLESELETFRAGLATNVPTRTAITLAVTDKDQPELLARFRADRSVTVIVDPVLAAAVTGHEQLAGKSEIRVTATRVYLPGAPADTSIQVDLKRGGRCMVEPASGAEGIFFDTPTVYRSNVFRIVNGRFVDESEQDTQGTRMTWGGAAGTESIAVPLSGIYAAWTVRVPRGTIPLDQVSEIRIVFDVEYRSLRNSVRAGKRRAVTAAAPAPLVGVGGGLRYYRFAFASSNLGRAYARRFFTTGDLVKGGRGFFKNTPTLLGTLDKELPGVSMADLPRTLASDPRKLAALLDQIGRAAFERPQETHYAIASDPTGHRGVIRGVVAHDNAARRFFDKRFPLLGAFSAFPNGLLPIPGALGEQYLQTSRVQFLKDHAAELRAFMERVLTSAPDGLDYTGNYIVLGSGSMVRCVQHEIVENPDRTSTHVFHLQTTSWHVFDGSFVWAWRFDPAHPSQIAFLGIQSGKAAVVGVDQLNAWTGPVLMDFCNRGATDFLNARERGQTVAFGQLSLMSDPVLWARGVVLSALDRTSPVMQYLRSLAGPYTTVEVDDTVLQKIDATDDPRQLLATDLPEVSSSGVTVDGRPLEVPSPFGPPLAPPGSDDAARAIDRALEYVLTQSAYDELRERVVEYAREQLGGEWAARSSGELVATLLGEEKSLLHLGSLVRDQLLAPVIPQVKSVIERLTTSQDDREALIRFATDRFEGTITAPLLAEGGALRSTLEIEILDQQIKAIDQNALVANLTEAADRVAQAQRDLDRLRSETPANEDDRRRIQREIEAHERERDQAEEERERYQQQKDDLDHHDQRRTDYERREREGKRDVFRDREVVAIAGGAGKRA